MEDRSWQAEANRKFETANEPDVFFLEACPGAGKTYWALSLSFELQRRNPSLCILIASPTENIKQKFIDDATDEFSQTLKPNIPEGFPTGGYAGVSCTYHALASRIKELMCWGKKFILVLDECHHLDSDDEGGRVWGEAAVRLQSLASHTLLLSGTPFRSVGTIPFLDQCREDDHRFAYTYGDGIAGRVVRPLFFNYDNDAAWGRTVTNSKGEVKEYNGDANTDEHKGHRNHAIFSVKDEWVSKTIIDVARSVDDKRASGDHDAAALFICRRSDRNGKAGMYAKAMARRIRELTGEKPLVVLSSEKGSSDEITKFEAGSSKYIVSIAMVSEGVDIPRVRCIALMTCTESELRFRQIMGRAVRWEKDLADDQEGTVFLPPFPQYQDWSAKMLEEISQGKKNRPVPVDPPTKPKVSEDLSFDSWSTKGEHVTVVGMDNDLSETIADLRKKHPEATDDALYKIADVLKRHESAEEPRESPEELKKRYRSDCHRLSNRVYFKLKGTKAEKTYGEINSFLNKRQGVDGIDDVHDNYTWEKMEQRRDALQAFFDKLEGGK